ncbi:MAG: hypothetical protein GY909_16035 [Oligoflexia bacterium]|nr:hypothetical protein [Oligoflexia bacterium]
MRFSFLVIITILCSCSALKNKKTMTYYSMSEGLRIREKPSKNSYILGNLSYNEPVTVLVGKGSNGFLKSADGGYIWGNLLSETKGYIKSKNDIQFNSGWYEIINKKVNVYNSPSTSSDIRYKLKKGDLIDAVRLDKTSEYAEITSSYNAQNNQWIKFSDLGKLLKKKNYSKNKSVKTNGTQYSTHSETRTIPASFHDCIDKVNKTIDTLRRKDPSLRIKRLVTVGDMRMYKIWASDATVLLTCSRPDRKLTIVTTKNQ